MPLFACSKCGCVENTALGKFWAQRDAPLCSQCATGAWHGRFERKNATGYLVDREGYIYSPNEAKQFEHRGPFQTVGLPVQ
jgi:hypothetical protein